jgi:hypothetical protein
VLYAQKEEDMPNTTSLVNVLECEEPSAHAAEEISRIIQARTCHACRIILANEVIECPSCGAINLDRKRLRHEDNRPTRSIVQSITSANHNGKYNIYQNSDGSYSCNCLSFLRQKDVRNGSGFAMCKHIAEYVRQNQTEALHNPPKPSDWQLIAMKRLGVECSEHLTDAQAYFIFRDMLGRQGVEYREYESLLKEHGTVSLLPIYSFGVEFEGFVPRSHGVEGLAQSLSQAGIPTRNLGYTHDLMNEWKIVPDGSLGGLEEYSSMELVTPKLFGAVGFHLLKKALDAWKTTGADVNATCGTHVHIDAYNWERRDMLELAKVWARIEQKVVWGLVSPSRRNNRYCSAVDREYLKQLAAYGATHLDRYHSLNLSSYGQYHTVEFRIHSGTCEAKKIIPWIVFLLKLTDSVKRGLTHRDLTDLSIEGVLDAIGLNRSATSLLREAREYLIERHQYWVRDAELYPSHAWTAQEIDVEGIEEEMRYDNALRLYRQGRRAPVTTGNPGLATNSVTNLASQVPSASLSDSELVHGVESNTWDVRSPRGRLIHIVERHPDDTLTCSCRSFRSQRHCIHTVNIARFLTAVRQESGGVRR